MYICTKIYFSEVFATDCGSSSSGKKRKISSVKDLIYGAAILPLLNCYEHSLYCLCPFLEAFLPFVSDLFLHLLPSMGIGPAHL